MRHVIHLPALCRKKEKIPENYWWWEVVGCETVG